MLKRFLVPDADQVLVSESDARAATATIFRKMGMTPDDADIATDVLITSDLRGCESHGVSNMLRAYVHQYSAAIINPRPDVKILRDSPVAASCPPPSATAAPSSTGAMSRRTSHGSC